MCLRCKDRAGGTDFDVRVALDKSEGVVKQHVS